ncbi:MAG TPA: hydantoinase/oxoprolinase family protein [Longimicrobiales bacterium]|nr:hydantoinase/oxoprolinase family protein [Longimicrobiales bacterium]
MSEPPAGLSIVAVDTGGTFTDVVVLRGGELRVLKVPSTPEDPAVAVLAGIRAALEKGPSAPELASGDVASSPSPGSGPAPGAAPSNGAPGRAPARGEFVLIHGSTVATNALLERRGARVGLVTNRHFEDILEIGRQTRPQLYALAGRRPPPLVAREDRHGVAGRLGPRGEELEPLDEAELAALPDRLRGVAAVAICLLHSYANPEHERRVAEALSGLGVPVSASSALLPEYREYERTATTVVNAYVSPLMAGYLGRIEGESGARRVRIMGSGGGAVPISRARREAVHTVLSGPAGGVMGALEVARAAGFEQIITFDMGGTSTDVSLCPGRPLHTREFTIAGLPVAVPVIDIHTVGAGGGSIARLDAGGALRVGPESAGAVPGPICYGLGGTRVTVTDAHVWLGRLPADAFLGGARRLDRDRVAGPLAELAAELGSSPDAAAEGVLAVADTAMEGALRVISVERGYDPADFTLVPFGGAAGLHAVELAERLGIPRILVPPDPGVLSAFGMLVAPVRKDVSRTVLLAGDEASPERLEGVFRELEEEAVAAMAEEGFPPDRTTLRRTVDARYRRQSYELRVPAENWTQAFHAAHEARFGFAHRDAVVEAVTLRVEATAPGAARPVRRLAPATDDTPPVSTVGDVVFRGEKLRVPRIDRAALLAGHRVCGPAIVAEYSATFWLPSGWHAEVRPCGSLLAERRA